VRAALHLRVPWDAWWYPIAELVVVALPEEFFFRGYVQGRLAEVWSSRVGPVVVASALFALCHLAVQGSPATLAVFFPGLVFGLLRARTGSIVPGALFHALCNLYIQLLQASLYG
jgi:membrane protease YdiL (CAAX protease family)